MTDVGRWWARILGVASGMAILTAPGAAQAGTMQLTLGDAARVGAERSATVLQARSRLRGAEARVRESTGDLLPSLDASVLKSARTFNTASFGLDFQIPGQEPLFDPEGEVRGPVRGADARAHLELPLLDLGALGRRRGAQAGADAARAEISAVEDMAAIAAARAYVGVLRARAEVSAREEDEELAGELLTVAQGQLDAGVAVVLDVTRAEAQLATVRAQLLAARHRAEAAELALRRALRVDDDVIVELADDLGGAVDEPIPDEQVALATALERRGELRTAEAYQLAAEESLSAVKAGRLPRLTASLDEGYYGRGFGHVLNTYSWTVRLSVPVFDGFQRSARIQGERARIEELRYRIEDLEADVRFQVRQALLNIHAAQEQVAAADERLRLAGLEVAQEEDRLLAGVAGTADLVRAAMRLNEARTADLETRAAAWMARVALASAMGTARDLR